MYQAQNYELRCSESKSLKRRNPESGSKERWKHRVGGTDAGGCACVSPAPLLKGRTLEFKTKEIFDFCRIDQSFSLSHGLFIYFHIYGGFIEAQFSETFKQTNWYVLNRSALFTKLLAVCKEILSLSKDRTIV